MNFFYFINFDFFLFLLLIFQIKSSTPFKDSLEIVAQFNIIQFKNESGKPVNCSNCLLAGIKLSKNGDIFCSFPRWNHSVYATFAKYNKKEKIFEAWPSIEENQKYLNNSSSGINSVLGFEIDPDDNLYILDQGKINNSPALEGSLKVMKYSLNTSTKIKEYIFDSSIADPENSFLNDIVIDIQKNRAYISDSGISLDGELSHYKPGIIVLDLNNSNVHRILSNDKSVFPDETFWLHVNKSKVREDKPMMTGVDGLALSCDGKALFYCPLTGRILYSVLTSDIDKAIENKKYDDIKVYSAFKKEASDG